MASGAHLSKEFFELLKAIGESKSKQEEDRIITREVVTLKKKLESSPASVPGAPAPPNTKLAGKKRSKEFLVRLLYVEMLGHDGSFGYIKAVELAASSSILHKRTGYLVCASCLSPDHEFRFMLVNQMQRDLNSSHVLEACAALLAVTSLITTDMVPAVSNEVSKLLGHTSETVRKKAILALHRLHQMSPDVVTKEDLMEKLRRVLCDRDPAVMGASLNVIEAMARRDVVPYKDLIPSLVSILKQILEHRLPTDFDYHRVPAPWMQMKLVRILGLLGKNDNSSSNGMYEILSDCLKKADVGINAGYAVVYECVRTITAIYPNPTLLDAAADAISRFISSRSHNLKYLGVNGLAFIVESHPQYAAAHQLAVIECLEDPDETLQRKTLDLLYRMTNPVNVEFITEKMLHFLRGTADPYLKRDLTTRICNVAERYAPDNAWYIRTITELFEISGDLVKMDVAQNLMSLIAEGSGEDEEEADMLLRQNAVELYANLLNSKPPAKLPRILLETMAWCLGEYGYLSAAYSLDDILNKLCHLARTGEKQLQAHPSTRRFLLQAIFKLVAQAGTCPPHAAKVIDDFSKSRDVDLQQRCLEFQNLLTSAAHILGEVLPVDASCEDLQVDEDLNFLNGFVREAVVNGAQEYEKPEDMEEDDEEEDDYIRGKKTPMSSAFKMTPYEKPTKPTAGSFGGGAMRGMGSDAGAAPGVTPPPGGGYAAGGAMGGGPAPAAVDPNTGQPSLVLRPNVANVWGRGGLNPAVAPAPAPLPAAASRSGFDAAPAPVSSYGSPAALEAEPPKSKELTERERMAAALFGGIVPGAVPPPPPAPAPAAPPIPKAPAHMAAPPAPAPAPAPEIDLLDMSFAPEPAPAPSGSVSDFDILSPSSVSAPEPVPPAPAPEPASAPAPASVDPFAAVGLLGDVTDKPLASLERDNKFEYSGAKMAPLPITTAQFGTQWMACTATSPATITGTKIDTLDKFMKICDDAGAHTVEAIAATNEGIAAGMVSGSIVVLIHGKITPLPSGGSKLEVTVKSSDATAGGCLSMFLQNMMR